MAAGARILLVDDSALVRAIMTKRLEALDLEVVAVSDGAGALEWLGGHACDLVIADLNMPGMSGAELCTVIQANLSLRHILIIVLTGSIDDLTMTDLDCGAVDYLQKDISREDLVATVTRALGGAAERLPSGSEPVVPGDP